MKREEIETKVEEILNDYVQENNIEIVEVEYVKEGTENYLRIYAEKEGGITLDDCVKLSRYVDPILDEKDIVPGEYRLQVSSPGLDRTLKKEKDFVRYKGRIVELKTYEKVNNTKEFEGELLGLFDNIVKIKNSDDEELSFEKNQISVIKLKVIL